MDWLREFVTLTVVSIAITMLFVYLTGNVDLIYAVQEASASAFADWMRK